MSVCIRHAKEKAPLLSQRRLFRSLSGRDISSNGSEGSNPKRTLGTFGGVFAPVCLSQFSSLLFLRVGFIVGNLGLLVACGSLTLAYAILLFTILSICAISTNGAVEGGGAYYMISRTLGPEFGGAIGILFFFANVFSSALYTTGCVEGLVDNFGESGSLAQFLLDGKWYQFGYGSAVNVLNMLVCLVGAGLFAKLTVLIYAVVLICTGSVILSYLVEHDAISVPIPSSNPIVNDTNPLNGTYTGFSARTLKNNLYINYSHDYTNCDDDEDYSTCITVNFAMTFGVLFSGVTGIMAGANMSGRLTHFIGLISIGSNPIGAVIVSAIMVECVLLIGGLNQIAEFTSIFFLLSYLGTNLACLGLEWASAPNFRPTFHYFSWWTSVLGMIGNGAMMFVISPSVAAICIILLLVLIIILHLRSPSEEHQWGSISQALIFHQVGTFDDDSKDPAAQDYPKWMALVKAFVEVTVAPTVRDGLHHLARVSGLGAMKPNTILLGFKDNTPSQDFFTRYEISTSFSYGSIAAETEENAQLG
ncbi:Solute carrier family 12 member 9 [Portunus trituberculatus]|uniref:Solute carrier family 12 member 9 n=1 Tax=Portunus trituberculatus TaxID=210409 RepID=A0A5B7CVB4_PORTR|nr:Solute carrier family 12 member 9 [Portunus trituberculatus]